MRRAVVLGIVGAALAGFICWGVAEHRVVIAPTGGRGGAYVRAFDHPKPGLESALAAGDGQAYAALARDPAMGRPGAFRASRAEVAYRYQRPLFGYLAWVASAGRARLEPRAQAVLAVLSVGLLVGAVAALLARRRQREEFALLMFLAPGVVVTATTLTADALATALLVLGVLEWLRKPRRTVAATIVLSLAMLTRETCFVGIAALAATELVPLRRLGRAAAAQVLPLLIPCAAYAIWVTFVRVRVGAWPTALASERISYVPAEGLLRDLRHLRHPAPTALAIVVTFVVVITCLLYARRDRLTVIVAAYGAFSLFLGTAVWLDVQDFGRVLLPAYAFGIVVLVTARSKMRSSSRAASSVASVA